MKRWRVLASLLIAAAGLLLVVGLSGAQRPARAATMARGAVGATQPVTSTLSYQGLLEEDGQPVTGQRQMTFGLYTDSACTAQVGSAQSRQVQVDDGLFSVDLAFGAEHFSG